MNALTAYLIYFASLLILKLIFPDLFSVVALIGLIIAFFLALTVWVTPFGNTKDDNMAANILFLIALILFIISLLM